MDTARRVAFSDGVIAVALTIMVLDQRVPEGADLAAPATLVPQALSYALSFICVGICRTNHHHLLQVADRVSGAVFWANLHLLF